MSNEMLQSFLQSALKQVRINRLVHEGSEEVIPELDMEKWTMIVTTHTGHLAEAVINRDTAKMERELLHIAAPLLELYLALKSN
ncbi:hypothetical protein [Desulfofundulus thermocisternus]|uniref:hypothetical protein n=1 Tax=Desulfofundulus thermocisternus TaxID=42471 RepID=UPI00217DD897|nr:hypothetical protein [Desulfofundulus thermocisternus]MCS5696963.1 hypothetical protein [Desulfofundulus thermocisternus]